MRTYLLLIAALFGAASIRCQADDIDLFRNRLITEVLDQTSTSNVEPWMSSQQNNGSWSDLNYASTSPTGWDPSQHLGRLGSIAATYHDSGSQFYHSQEASDAVSAGLDFFLETKPKSPNGWQNIIGAPLNMVNTLLLMESQLSPDQITDAYEYCLGASDPEYGGIRGNGYVYAKSPATGQNLVWLAGIHASISSLDHIRDLAGIEQAYTALQDEVYISHEEGIRQDYAFHQHSRQLYNGQYGARYVHDIAYWIQVGAGLNFGFTNDRIELFSHLILDGTQWMIRRDTFDWACMGRSISRPPSINTPDPIISKALERMIDGGFPRQSEFQAFLDHISGNNDAALTGNKHFWLADYQSHRRENFHVGIKMLSRRTYTHEAGNGENLQGYYLSQGATMISMDGDEYNQIYPVWDWGRIPGTTTPHKDPAPKAGNWYPPLNQGKTGFVGGASDGACGVAAMDQDWDGVQAKKAWFCFDKEIICLGAGINATSEVSILTSVNQCIPSGVTRLAEESGTTQNVFPGNYPLHNPLWVFNDQLGYVFPQPAEVTLNIGSQSGKWNEINLNGNGDTITKTVFSLWFDHGTEPNNAKYSYVLLPGTSSAETADYAASIPFQILANQPEIQAVHHQAKGLTGIVFHQAGSIQINEDMAVSCDDSAILLIDWTLAHPRITLAKPDADEGSVKVRLTGNFNIQIEFELPEGEEQGRSQTLSTAHGTDLSTWAGIPVEPNGHVLVNERLGWININHAPWVWIWKLRSWAFIPEPSDPDAFWSFLINA